MFSLQPETTTTGTSMQSIIPLRCLRTSTRSSLPRRCLSTPSASAPSVTPPKAALVQSLDLDQKIQKLPIKGSLMSHIAVRQLDMTVLRFPAVVSGVDEYRHTVKQRRDVRDNFARIMIESPDTLREEGLHDLWRLSATEATSVYESMGESGYRTDTLTLTSSADMRSDPLLSREFNCNVIKLIILNHLVMPMINRADNPDLKKRLLNERSRRKIAFAYTEKHAALGSLLPVDWTTEAKRKDQNLWLVSGSKSYILHDDYDDYIIFCKTRNRQEVTQYEESDGDVAVDGEEKSDFTITAFVLPKDRLDSVEEFEEAGIKYQRIWFPNLLLTTDDMLIMPSEESGNKVKAIKSAAQLAVSSFLLGRMKAACESCGRHLDATAVDDTTTFGWNYMNELVLNIYQLESTIYYTAGLFDSFEDRDLTSECMIVKAIANDTSHECVNLVQRILGPGHPVAGPMHDMLEMYDSFLDCPLHCKILTAIHTLRTWGRYNNDHLHKKVLSFFYVRYWFVDYWRRKPDESGKSRRMFQLDQIIHSDLAKQADILEDMIVRMDYMVDDIFCQFWNEVSRAQMQNLRMGEIECNIFKLIATLTRASRSMDLQLPGHEQEADLARQAARKIRYDTQELEFYTLQGRIANWDEDRIRMHHRNILYHGYFPFSPLDKIMY